MTFKLIWPKSAEEFFCQTCGRVGELDAEQMMQCGPRDSGPCIWIPQTKKAPPAPA
jgi:hypothetical protein